MRLAYWPEVLSTGLKEASERKRGEKEGERSDRVPPGPFHARKCSFFLSALQLMSLRIERFSGIVASWLGADCDVSFSLSGAISAVVKCCC